MLVIQYTLWTKKSTGNIYSGPIHWARKRRFVLCQQRKLHFRQLRNKYAAASQKKSRVHDEGVKNTPYIEEEEKYVGILTFLGIWQVKNTTPLDKTADPQLDSKREVYQLMSVSNEGDEEAVKFFSLWGYWYWGDINANPWPVSQPWGRSKSEQALPLPQL